MSSLVHAAQDGLDGLLGELAGGTFVLTDGHGFEVAPVLVPMRPEEGFGFAQFLEDLRLALEPAQRLARLRARHPVVVRALHAGGPTADLHALLVDVQSRVDALAARVEGFEAGFAEARKAGTAGREAEPAREATPARSERPRRAGFDDAAAPMALLDLRGHVHAINAAFSALVGYREDEFTKAVWPSAHDRGDYREQCDQLRRMAAGELESVGVRSTYMHGTGLLVPVRGELTLVRDAEGRPEHLRLSAQERSSH